jgi:hypothetical protein
MDAGDVHQIATRKDKGVSRKGKRPSSCELVMNEDNSQDSDEENVDGDNH